MFRVLGGCSCGRTDTTYSEVLSVFKRLIPIPTALDAKVSPPTTARPGQGLLRLFKDKYKLNIEQVSPKRPRLRPRLEMFNGWVVGKARNQ